MEFIFVHVRSGV